jgi:hypothetical protein
MTGLTNIPEGSVLTVRTYKTLGVSRLAWANSYEIRNVGSYIGGDTVIQVIDTLSNIFKSFERSVLHARYTFDRIVFSTYVEDSKPYNPYTFVSVPVNLPGQYNLASATALPLELCTLVKRSVPFGRQGNILYRGIVVASDADIGSAGTTIKSARLQQIQQAVDSFLAALQGQGFSLVMASGKGQVDLTTLRDVTSLSVKADMRFKKLNNRYFDKVRNTN